MMTSDDNAIGEISHVETLKIADAEAVKLWGL